VIAAEDVTVTGGGGRCFRLRPVCATAVEAIYIHTFNSSVHPAQYTSQPSDVPGSGA
jgi:hypothetical protein